jgi:hypothetical protein
MTVTQQIQKEMMNQKRQQSYDFKKEDKIWLNLKNIHTDCSCKFDAKNVKYIIVKKINLHFFCLKTLLGIHNVFHSVMLQSAVMNVLFFSVYDRSATSVTNSEWQRIWNRQDFEESSYNREEFKKKYLIK